MITGKPSNPSSLEEIVSVNLDNNISIPITPVTFPLIRTAFVPVIVNSPVASSK